jgi:transposase InsO family protein
MVKLTDKNIKWIIRHSEIQKDETTESISVMYKISERRVQQIRKEYKDIGEIPRLIKSRRPKTELSEADKEMIKQAWEKKRLGARLLFYELKSEGHKIPHNKINKYLLSNNLTIPDPKKQKQRKRCRYERKHTGSLIHGDWHRTSESHPHAIIWLDDASRYALTGGEFNEATSEHSIETFETAKNLAFDLKVLIRHVNTDRGTQFYSNKNEGTCEFEKYLESQSIKHIPSRRNNPQTNGKLERLWYEYDKHRWRFNSLQDFLDWYNSRIHGSLDYRNGETPGMALIRKMPPAASLGLFLSRNE